MICLENYWYFKRIKATVLDYHCSSVLLFTVPPLGVQSIAVSLSVMSDCISVHSHISKTTCPNFIKFSVHDTVVMPEFCSEDSAIYTSSLLVDAMFAHNQPGVGHACRAYIQSDSPDGSTGGKV